MQTIKVIDVDPKTHNLTCASTDRTGRVGNACGAFMIFFIFVFRLSCTAFLQALPRSPEDADSAFIVLSGAVHLAFGPLGEYLFAKAHNQTILEASSSLLGCTTESAEDGVCCTSSESLTLSPVGDTEPAPLTTQPPVPVATGDNVSEECTSESPFLHYDEAPPTPESIRMVGFSPTSLAE
jgi:hypothetical protein